MLFRRCTDEHIRSLIAIPISMALYAQEHDQCYHMQVLHLSIDGHMSCVKVRYDECILVSLEIVTGANETPKICFLISFQALFMMVGIDA